MYLNKNSQITLVVHLNIFDLDTNQNERDYTDWLRLSEVRFYISYMDYWCMHCRRNFFIIKRKNEIHYNSFYHKVNCHLRFPNTPCRGNKSPFHPFSTTKTSSKRKGGWSLQWHISFTYLPISLCGPPYEDDLKVNHYYFSRILPRLYDL